MFTDRSIQCIFNLCAPYDPRSKVTDSIWLTKRCNKQHELVLLARLTVTLAVL